MKLHIDDGVHERDLIIFCYDMKYITKRMWRTLLKVTQRPLHIEIIMISQSGIFFEYFLTNRIVKISSVLENASTHIILGVRNINARSIISFWWLFTDGYFKLVFHLFY